MAADSKGASRPPRARGREGHGKLGISVSLLARWLCRIIMHKRRCRRFRSEHDPKLLFNSSQGLFHGRKCLRRVRYKLVTQFCGHFVHSLVSPGQVTKTWAEFPIWNDGISSARRAKLYLGVAISTPPRGFAGERHVPRSVSAAPRCCVNAHLRHACACNVQTLDASDR